MWHYCHCSLLPCILMHHVCFVEINVYSSLEGGMCEFGIIDSWVILVTYTNCWFKTNELPTIYCICIEITSTRHLTRLVLSHNLNQPMFYYCTTELYCSSTLWLLKTFTWCTRDFFFSLKVKVFHLNKPLKSIPILLILINWFLT